jgi:KDO2-lipid IV(A) lauroyltransferase
MKEAPLRHGVEYALYLALKGCVRALPHAATRSFGAAVGWLGHRVDRRHREIARRNVSHAFPELAPSARRRLVAACFRHFGGALCDFISAARFDAVETCRRFSYEGWEHLDAAERLGRGVFLLGAHHGYWEISGRPIGLYKGVIHTVARPADNPRLERELARLRARNGYSVIHKRGAARRMLQALRDGERIGILPDQRVRANEGIMVPFFGRPASTTPVLARLSLRSGAPVVPVFAYPRPRGRYHLAIRAPILPADVIPAGVATGAGSSPAGADSAGAESAGAGSAGGNPAGADSAATGSARADHPDADPAETTSDRRDDPAAVALLTRRYLEVIEEEIRRNPEMWLWMHQRWEGREKPPSAG